MPTTNTVFISYCWNDKLIAESIDSILKECNVKTIRDVNDLKFRDSISEFMKRVRKTDFTLLLISDAYLKSQNCMTEVVEFLKEEEYRKKIIPVVVEGTSIFSTESILNYVSYWNTKFTELNSLYNNIPIANLDLTDLKTTQKIASTIHEFIAVIKDTNCKIVGDVTKKELKDVLELVGVKEVIRFQKGTDFMRVVGVGKGGYHALNTTNIDMFDEKFCISLNKVETHSMFQIPEISVNDVNQIDYLTDKPFLKNADITLFVIDISEDLRVIKSIPNLIDISDINVILLINTSSYPSSYYLSDIYDEISLKLDNRDLYYDFSTINQLTFSKTSYHYLHRCGHVFKAMSEMISLLFEKKEVSSFVHLDSSDLTSLCGIDNQLTHISIGKVKLEANWTERLVDQLVFNYDFNISSKQIILFNMIVSHDCVLGHFMELYEAFSNRINAVDNTNIVYGLNIDESYNNEIEAIIFVG